MALVQLSEAVGCCGVSLDRLSTKQGRAPGGILCYMVRWERYEATGCICYVCLHEVSNDVFGRNGPPVSMLGPAAVSVCACSSFCKLG